MNNKVKIFTVLVVAVLIITSYIIFKDNDYNVNELREKDIIGSISLDSGKSYTVKDDVLDVVEFSLPKTEANKYFFTVDSSFACNYTAIWFESAPHYPLYFMGNKSSNFPTGEEIEFSLEVNEYSTWQYPYCSSLETTFVTLTILDVYSAIIAGNYSMVEFDKTLNGNEYTLTVTGISKYLPRSIYWSSLRSVFGNVTIDVQRPPISIFDSDDNLIGVFINETTDDVQGKIEVGQKLKFTIDNDYIGKIFINFFADIFPNATASDYTFFDEFPLTKIDL